MTVRASQERKMQEVVSIGVLMLMKRCRQETSRVKGQGDGYNQAAIERGGGERASKLCRQEQTRHCKFSI